MFFIAVPASELRRYGTTPADVTWFPPPTPPDDITYFTLTLEEPGGPAYVGWPGASKSEPWVLIMRAGLPNGRTVFLTVNNEPMTHGQRDVVARAKARVWVKSGDAIRESVSRGDSDPRGVTFSTTDDGLSRFYLDFALDT